MWTPVMWFIFLYLSSFGVVLGLISVSRGIKTLHDVRRHDTDAYYSSFDADLRAYLQTQMPKFRAGGYVNIVVGLLLSIGSSILLWVVILDIISIW